MIPLETNGERKVGLVNPHGKERTLMPLLLPVEERPQARQRAEQLPKIRMTSRETSDLIMMGIGAFTPVSGFMHKADWKDVCDRFSTVDGDFWPIPITLSVNRDQADGIRHGAEAA